MDGECYFCHGIVSAAESDHIMLDSHADHEVYMHEQCAIGHNFIEESTDSIGSVEITCPECGTIETT